MSEFLNVSIDVKQGIREAVEQIAAEPGTKVFYLDGKKINSKETFLSKAAEAMQFPTYFGVNWDAFDECITDLTWFQLRDTSYCMTMLISLLKLNRHSTK
ncbi:MAG: barstar family protein [Nostoc sp.]